MVLGPVEGECQVAAACRLLHCRQVWPAAVHVHLNLLPRGPAVLLQALQKLRVALGPQHLAQEVRTLCVGGGRGREGDKYVECLMTFWKNQ